MPSTEAEEMATTTNTQTFPSWTFDKACPSMEWMSLSSVDVKLLSEITVKGGEEGTAALPAVDLLILPVITTAVSTQEEEEEEEVKEEERTTDLLLEGVASEMDTVFAGGALTELLQEHSKSLQKRGGTSPVIRVVSADGKVTKMMLLAMGATMDDDATRKSSSSSSSLVAAGFTIGKAIASTLAAEKKIGTACVVLPDVLANNKAFMTDLVTATYQSLYVDNRFRSKKKPVAENLSSITIACAATNICDASVVEQGKQIAMGINLARDIVNAPHNVLNSESLAESAQRMAAESPSGNLVCHILDKNDCEAQGMGAYLAVARGSETEPQFIHLVYKSPQQDEGEVKTKKLALVGKGVLFDTGGYNIKTTMMELMKFDCGGAAAVLGAARAISLLGLEGVEVHFIVAACENMVNDKAYVPSDILIASNGLTIEVMNTDAEGRLTLADALVYADKEVGADKILELSTLTGSCMVSLGKKIAGVWTNDDALAAEVDAASKVTGEKTWRMPMANEYEDQLESQFADLKNLGTRYGGSITAALFLQNFVQKGKPFCHVDIAGPAWEDGKGATGYGTKLIVEWIKQHGQQ